MTLPWYTITVVQHEKHPSQYEQNDPVRPVEVVSCTVRPSLAGSILRATADEIAPHKPAMRGRPDQ